MEQHTRLLFVLWHDQRGATSIEYAMVVVARCRGCCRVGALAARINHSDKNLTRGRLPALTILTDT